MNATNGPQRLMELSPRSMARLAGLSYLLVMVTGIFAQSFVSDRLVVFGDATATATNILAHRSLFQWGFAVYLIEMTTQIVSIALFYLLLKPVSRTVALLAAFIGLAGCTIKAMSRLFYIAPLFLLDGGHALAAFNAEQLQALAVVLLKVNDLGAGIALAFFGFRAMLEGYLIVRSTFLPRILGVLGLITGAGLLSFLSPPLGHRLFPYLAAIGLLASVAVIGWLLVFGVNEERWRNQAGLAATSIWR
jgi:hypothetical protein